MKTRYFVVQILLLIISNTFVSCAGKPAKPDQASFDLLRMSDHQLKARVVGKSLTNAQYVLGLDRYKSDIAEGSAFGFPIYRYYIGGGKLLFLETDPSNNVIGGFFSILNQATNGINTK
jgi:hypothetical protein